MNELAPDLHQITGQITSHLEPLSGSVWLHKETVSDWQALRVAAANAGFELSIASGFRSFERQLLIWNEKASGKRVLLDAKEQPVSSEEVADMSDKELLFTILRWSAIPGCSRHHWGTDVDVYDKKCVSSNESFELLAEDCSKGGRFAALHQWLDEQIANNAAKGFFRPYEGRRGFLHEPWHLSHRPVSERFEAELSQQLLLNFYQQNNSVALSGVIVDNFELIYEQYISVRD